MYLVAIAWLYVALMMAVAEATHSAGSLLGAFITFVLYGLLPVALVLYLLGTPARRRARRAREAAELQTLVQTGSEGLAVAAQGVMAHHGPETPQARASAAPDTGGHAPAGAEPGAVAPVGKEA